MTDTAKTAATATKPEALRANLPPQQGMLPRPASSIRTASSHLMTLHRTLGNQAVGKLIQQSQLGSQESGVMQAKLSINKPNDIFEREADQVADQVMRMPETEVRSQKSGVGSRGSDVRGGSGIVQTKPG